MLALDLVLVLVATGLIVGTQFRVMAMAPLALAACACAFLEALTLGASGTLIVLRVAEAAVFFELAYAIGAVLVRSRWAALGIRAR